MSIEERVASHEARLNAINGSQARAADAAEALEKRVGALAVEVAVDREVNRGEHQATRKELRIFAGLAVGAALIGGYLPGAHSSTPHQALTGLARLITSI